MFASFVVSCCNVSLRWLAILRESRPSMRTAFVRCRDPLLPTAHHPVLPLDRLEPALEMAGGGTHGAIRAGGQRPDAPVDADLRAGVDRHRLVLLHLDLQADRPVSRLLRDGG